MCGRVCVKHTNREIEESFDDLEMPYPLEPKYNIPPTSSLITVSDETNGRQAVARTWGLIPHWSKSPNLVKNTFNARLETADQKPTFRSALRHHRCVIPITGYFEWQSKGKTKQPFYFKHKNNKPLLLAGIWDEWDKNDHIIQSFSIVTTEAINGISQVHHRMPIFLNPSEIEDWLDSRKYQNPKKEFSWLHNREDSLNSIEFYPVSDEVNSVYNDNEHLLEEKKAKPVLQQTEFNF